METQTLPTKTFKEVHEELEMEASLLKKNHNVAAFKEKAEFLTDVGFIDSIATKLYAAIAENQGVIAEYERKYLGRYKFILGPQLERICEKYNLFVRPVHTFLGDIPEKNIKEMKGFSVFVEDLALYSVSEKAWTNHWQQFLIGTGSNSFSENETWRLPIRNIAKVGMDWALSIAAIKPLFSAEAFEKSESRIIGPQELTAKGQVDLDPIVLFQTKHGYLIITAWGDEANDELVVNQKNN